MKKIFECNRMIEAAIDDLSDSNTEESIICVLESIRMALNEGSHFLLPVDYVDKKGNIINDRIDDFIEEGHEVPEDSGIEILNKQLDDGEGGTWMVVFTSDIELEKGPETSAASRTIDDCLDDVTDDEELSGLIINPWGENFMLNKEMVQAIREINESEDEEEADCLGADLDAMGLKLDDMQEDRGLN